MFVSYIINLNSNEKSGLYKAVFDRIDRTIRHNVFNLNYYDSFFIVFLKKILRIKIIKNEPLANDLGIEVININIKITLYNYLARYFNFSSTSDEKIANALYSMIKMDMPDVIVAHGGGVQTNVASLLSAKYNIPQVNVFHGSDIHSHPHTNLRYKQRLQNDMKHANMNVFVSNALLNHSKKIYKGDNVVVIRNGISLTKSNEDYGLPSSKMLYKIAYIGNLYSVKGVDRLPEIAKVVKSKIDASFYIIGNGTLMDFLRVNMPDDTVFTGAIDNRYIMSILKQVDLIVLPSRNEGLPLILCEALSVGTKIVSTDVGGIPELIESEFLVNAESLNLVEDFALKIISSLKKPIIPVSKYDTSIEITQRSEREMLMDICRSNSELIN
ncbi:glycosyltransferase [Aliivibrio fischeri]|uniref:glycosyltransferase n=1 Tax=Aliivibrio fischeri TaxID=668 RepID=UPI0007C4C155|nr:glycosyltransferase [Aliivibrio fischeri]